MNQNLKDGRLFAEAGSHALLNFCLQGAHGYFFFRSNCFEGVPLAASYIRDAHQEIPPDLGAEVQQFLHCHLADLLRFRHGAVPPLQGNHLIDAGGPERRIKVRKAADPRAIDQLLIDLALVSALVTAH
jgi:hypothetical protein